MQSSPPSRASGAQIQITPERPTQITTPQRPKKLQASTVYIGTGSLDMPGCDTDKKSVDVTPIQKAKRKRLSSPNPTPITSHDKSSQNKKTKTKTKTNDDAAERAK